jgi:multiple sugar transport system substrate-binding protein
MTRFALSAAATVILLAAPAAAQQRRLTIATHYTDSQMAPITACLRQYEQQHPGLSIVHQQSAIADYLKTVMTGRVGGTSPDIYGIYSLWSAQLVDADVLASPPEEIRRQVADDYLPSTQDTIRVHGQIWGIPAEISTYMLVYNRKLLAGAGYEHPPSSWGELTEMAGRIAKTNAQGNLTTAGYAFGPTVANGVHPFEALLYSAGVAPYKPDLSGTNLTDPRAVAALAAQTRLFTNRATSDAMQVRDFTSGTVGMMIAANWFKKTLQDSFGPAMAETVGVAPLPAGPDWRTLQYGFFWGVDARSRSRAEAWKLVSWLNQPRVAGQRSCVGEMLVQLGGLTGNKADIAASQAEMGDDFTRPYVEAISSGRAVSDPNMPYATEIQASLRTQIGRAWNGAVPAAEALAAADRDITRIMTDPR